MIFTALEGHIVNCDYCQLWRQWLVITQSLERARRDPLDVSDVDLGAATYGRNRTVETY